MKASFSNELQGYEKPDLLAQTGTTMIHRAIRQSDKELIIVKSKKNMIEHLHSSCLLLLKNEYHLLKQSSPLGSLKVRDLVNHGIHLYLEFEDFSGSSLRSLLQINVLTLREKLLLAGQLAKFLHSLHQKQMLHNNITPDTIAYSLEKRQAKFLDFSLATKLEPNAPTPSYESLDINQLRYLSPERTGRVNQQVDIRSDYYSFGVLLYELFTGKQPFTSEDPIELIHHHIARQAIPPKDMAPTLPTILSELILKLLSKNADDRYQSAQGLLYDLENCLPSKYQANTSFVLGTRDFSAHLQFSQKVYGYDRERKLLLEAYQKTLKGKKQWLLLKGFSGTGKTMLLQELRKSIEPKGALLLGGSFEPPPRTKVFTAWIEILRELLQNLLTEPEQELLVWKAKILYLFQKHKELSLLQKYLPELQWVIGSLPLRDNTNEIESSSGLFKSFQKFIHLLSEKSPPVILHFKETQWATEEDILRLQELMSSKNNKYLMIVVSYRPELLTKQHPFHSFAHKLTHEIENCTQLKLSGITRTQLSSLLSETIKLPLEKLQELATLIFDQTFGNPLMVKQFLEKIYDQKHLYFDFVNHRWNWEQKKVQQFKPEEQAISFLLQEFEDLPIELQQTLQVASCLTEPFSSTFLEQLAQVKDCQSHQLKQATEKGFLKGIQKNDASDSLYYFSHKAFRNHSNQSLDPKKAATLHLQVAQLLVEQSFSTDQELLQVVEHYQKASKLVTDEQEITRVLSLLMQAISRCEELLSSQKILQYMRYAKQLMPQSLWEQESALAFAIHKTGAEHSYSNGFFTEAEELLDEAFLHEHSVYDQIELSYLKVKLLLRTGGYKESISLLKQSLHSLDIHFPASSEKDSFIKEQDDTFEKILQEKDYAHLSSLPKQSERHIELGIELLAELWTVALFSGEESLLRLSSSKMLELTFKCGQVPSTAFAYMSHSLELRNNQRFKEANRLAELALKLAEKEASPAMQGRLLNIFSYAVNPYRNHLRTNLALYSKAHQKSLAGGELTDSAWSLYFQLYTRFILGEPLQKIAEETEASRFTFKKQKNALTDKAFSVFKRFLYSLQVSTHNQASTSKSSTTQIVIQENSDNFQFIKNWQNVFQMQYLLLHNEALAAYELGRRCSQQKYFKAEFLPQTRQNFYYSLSILNSIDQIPQQQHTQLFDIIKKNQDALFIWSQNCPQNFEHLYFLIKAESAQAQQKRLQINQLYQRAALSAHKNGFLQDEALIHEQASRYYYKNGEEELSRKHLVKAYRRYKKWGAKVKVEALEQLAPEWLSSLISNPENSSSSTSSTSSQPQIPARNRLDFSSVLKASQTLSSEIDLAKLLQKLLQIVLENAGAHKGMLLLKKDEQLLIEAEGNLDAHEIHVLQSISLDPSDPSSHIKFPLSLLHYVSRTKAPIILECAHQDLRFLGDPYIQKNQTMSVLCLPIIKQTELIGILYLENNLIRAAFSSERLEIVQLLAAQAAISIENARLYTDLEQKVQERTQELKQSLEQLKQTQEHLIASEKQAALGRLVAGVAHELNTPIGNALTVASTLIEKNKSFQEQLTQNALRRSTLQQFAQDTDRASKLVCTSITQASELIKHFKQVAVDQTSERRRTFELHKVIDEVFWTYQPMFKRTPHKLKTSIPKGIEMDSYPGPLGQIIANLLTNSLKHGFEGIEKGFMHISAQINSDEQLCLIYKDNGIGMDINAQKRSFEPFFTTKLGSGGSGLGLHLVYNIATRILGGKIKLESQPQEGVTFTLLLPLQAPTHIERLD